jgi:hypothetical protein
MTLRIERVHARVRSSGDFRREHIDQIRSEMELCESPVVLDLEELHLVDVEAVRFLNTLSEPSKSQLGALGFSTGFQVIDRLMGTHARAEARLWGIRNAP